MNLEKMPKEELSSALNYVETLAQNCINNKRGIDEAIDRGEVTRAEMMPELTKLREIYDEHNSLSFKIEKELDKRWKKTLKLHYTTTSLLSVIKSYTKKMQDRQKEGPAEDKKAPLEIS